MNLSHREISLIVEELRALLLPSRVQKVFEATPETLVLQLRTPGRTWHLLLSIEDGATRLHLVDKKPTQPQTPTALTMLLRKWIQGAWIEAIELDRRDRILRFDLQAVDPEWEPADEDDQAPRVAVTLVAELLGRHPNLFLLDQKKRILGTAHPRVVGERTTRAGVRYDSPPPPPQGAEEEKVRAGLADLPPDGSRSETLQSELEAALEQRARKELEHSLKSQLKSQAKSLKRRVKHIEDDLSRIEDAEGFRRFGELLQSAYGKVAPGAKSARVPDFYQEGMPEVEVPLDPAKSLQKNIERYFHQYRRLTAARERVEERLLATMEELEAVEAARRELATLTGLEELEAFRDHYRQQKVLPKKGRQKRGAKRQKPLPPYRQFTGRAGATILVGRGARHNDDLTTSVARGRDLWLHARDWAGAHVVVRLNRGEEVHHEDLLDAATLAAYFSRGKEDTLVDVTYTHAKHVRKPPGAAPGLVTVAAGSTIGVRIEDERLQRLLESEVEQQ